MNFRYIDWLYHAIHLWLSLCYKGRPQNNIKTHSSCMLKMHVWNWGWQNACWKCMSANACWSFLGKTCLGPLVTKAQTKSKSNSESRQQALASTRASAPWHFKFWRGNPKIYQKPKKNACLLHVGPRLWPKPGKMTPNPPKMMFFLLLAISSHGKTNGNTNGISTCMFNMHKISTCISNMHQTCIKWYIGLWLER